MPMMSYLQIMFINFGFFSVLLMLSHLQKNIYRYNILKLFVVHEFCKLLC